MSVELDAERQAAAARRTGTVLAVCYSQELIDGVGKEPRESAAVTRLGVLGDRHYGETRYSQTRRATVPNDRPITVLGVEATRDACAKLGIAPVPPGGMGENLLVQGLGDLSGLQPGERLRFVSGDGLSEVVLEIRKQNEPCSNLQVYHRRMAREMYGKRGVICTVLQEGTVRPGDRVELLPAAPAGQ